MKDMASGVGVIMPAPFPGMDPYLEGSEWSSVHVALSAEMARQLVPKVQPKSIGRTARRLVTAMPEDIGRRVLYSTAHLMEIDLLRRGRRVPMQQPLPPAPYVVWLSRAQRRPSMEMWPMQLSLRLPTVPVPLLADEPAVS
jgi:hypothetical protein